MGNSAAEIDYQLQRDSHQINVIFFMGKYLDSLGYFDYSN